MSEKTSLEEEKKTGEECPPDQIYFDPVRGEKICLLTGEVIEEQVIDTGPDWRAYNQEESERRSRVGVPLTYTMHDLGVSAIVDYKNRDAAGRRLTGRKRLDAIKIRKWQSRSKVQTSIDRNLQQAMQELDKLAKQLGVPRHVQEEAAKIYHMAVNKGLVRGRSIESVIAASLYAACRIHRLPHMLDEIAQKVRGSRREIARCYRLIVRDLNLRVPVIDSKTFVARIAGALGLPDEAIVQASKFLEIAKKRGLTAGKDPGGLAAAAVYLAALMLGIKKTQKEVAKIAGVTEVTVRNRYKELAQELHISIDLEEENNKKKKGDQKQGKSKKK